MTRYRTMVDTNVVSDLIRHPHGHAVGRLRQHGDDGICISIIAAAELRYGCAKQGSAKLLGRVEVVLSGIDVVPFDVPADAQYGMLRATLEKAGWSLGPNDLFIAAHALAMDVVLATNNVGDFSRVPKLRVENWLTVG